MGNRSIQLPHDYKPNYEFPNLIVTLNDDSPSYGERPSVSQKIPGFNLDQVPVLYDQTSGVTILVQEEMVNIPITIVINCESQFQAKEIYVLVKRWLPLNKFISFLTFTSYLEVSDTFLSRSDFDPATHIIHNIYTKLNKRTGEIAYCYGLQYDPMIRLDSITSSIPDSTQRSFQVSVDITYMLPIPMYMFSDVQPGEIDRIDMLINPSTGFEPINDYPSSKSINYLSDEVINLKKGFIRRTYLVTDDSSTTNVLNLDSVSLAADQVTNTSTGGRKICATRGVDDYLYITLGDSETQYRTNINTIPSPDGVDIELSTDEYLTVTKALAGTITTVLHTIKQGLTIKFNPAEFLMSASYSYNLVKGANTLKDYQNYTLDLSGNSITFSFDNSIYSMYQPSITSPLMIQFYLKNDPPMEPLMGHVIFVDRLVHPNSIPEKMTVVHGDRELGTVEPFFFKDSSVRNKEQEYMIYLLSVLTRNVFPEVIGYPDPLHHADRGAKSVLKMVEPMLFSSEQLNRSNPLHRTLRQLRGG
jgi:hypothetical protein